MSGTVWIPVELCLETDLAWHVDFGGDNPIWVPKSQITDYSENEYEIGDDIEIELPEWLALKKGMI